MLVTKYPLFRKFWYLVIPMSELGNEPKSFELLEQPLVIVVCQG